MKFAFFKFSKKIKKAIDGEVKERESENFFLQHFPSVSIAISL